MTKNLFPSQTLKKVTRFLRALVDTPRDRPKVVRYYVRYHFALHILNIQWRQFHIINIILILKSDAQSLVEFSTQHDDDFFIVENHQPPTPENLHTINEEEPLIVTPKISNEHIFGEDVMFIQLDKWLLIFENNGKHAYKKLSFLFLHQLK